nr:MAG TPA: hypothetical protein [Caudoviricetes sp.]
MQLSCKQVAISTFSTAQMPKNRHFLSCTQVAS